MISHTGKAAKAESKWVDLDYSRSDPTPITSNTKFWSPKQFWTAIIFADLKRIGKWKLDSLRFLHSRLKSSSRHSRLIAKHSQEQELIVVPKMLDDSTMMCPLTSAGGSRQYSLQQYCFISPACGLSARALTANCVNLVLVANLAISFRKRKGLSAEWYIGMTSLQLVRSHRATEVYMSAGKEW